MGTKNLYILFVVWNILHHGICETFYTFDDAVYYSESSPFSNASHARYENNCQMHGKYLASIHSTSQKKQIIAICQCESCWIGLTFKLINNITTMNWMDDTNIDTSLINESWCLGYPIIDYTNINTSYSVYIDSTNNCWKSTSNSWRQMCGICGPKRFDISGNLYWIANLIIPLCLALIGLPYTLYCFIYLLYHLYGHEHNWLLEPTKYIKTTAILIPVMNALIITGGMAYGIVIFKAYNETGIMPGTTAIDSDYPKIYTVSGSLQIVVIGLYYLYLPMGYIHMLLRLNHVFNHNKYMQNIWICYVSWKRVQIIIVIAIILYFVCPLMLVLFKNIRTDYEDQFRMVIILFTFAIDVFINCILLLVYVKGLDEYSKKHYFRYDIAKQNENANTIDSRRHELALEATRHTVLFSIVSIFNVMGFIAFAVLYSFRILCYGDYDQPETIVTFSVLFFKEMILLIGIHLSFKFSHKTYSHVCGPCNKWMVQRYHKAVRKSNARMIRQYEVQQNEANPLDQPLIADAIQLEKY